MNYQNYITLWKEEQKKVIISAYDDCEKCNKEARLLKGLCFECWKNGLRSVGE